MVLREQYAVNPPNGRFQTTMLQKIVSGSRVALTFKYSVNEAHMHDKDGRGKWWWPGTFGSKNLGRVGHKPAIPAPRSAKTGGLTGV